MPPSLPFKGKIPVPPPRESLRRRNAWENAPEEKADEEARQCRRISGGQLFQGWGRFLPTPASPLSQWPPPRGSRPRKCGSSPNVSQLLVTAIKGKQRHETACFPHLILGLQDPFRSGRSLVSTYYK